LGFAAASEELAKTRKSHENEIARFRERIKSGTPKMRLLAQGKLLGNVERELAELKVARIVTADMILREGLLKQKLHDIRHHR